MNVITIAVLFIVVACVYIGLKKKKKENSIALSSPVEPKNQSTLLVDESNMFSSFLSCNPSLNTDGMVLLGSRSCYKKRHFLTESERKVFNSIKAMLPEKLTLLTQVRLVDFINPSDNFPYKSKEFIALFKEVSQLHCDFVLMDSEFSIVACIELDDAQATPEKEKKDLVMDEVFKQAEVKLFRFKAVSDTMTNDEFNELLESY
ncbi:TPA: DUF2726 domain-containing protein [Serratia fonticola]